MHFTNKLLVASLAAIASAFVAEAAPVEARSVDDGTGPVIALNSQEDFCLFLPPQPGLVVAVNEDNGIPFCTQANTVPNATLFPEGFITTAHYLRNSTYVQVTGFIDRDKYSLGSTDGGGQYDNHNKGKPVGAECENYNYFVSMIEPDINRFCIRCCQDEADCNTGRSEYGCLRIIDGDYTDDNNYINNSTTSANTTDDDDTVSTHSNADMNGVLAELEYLPQDDSSAEDDTTTSTTDTTTSTTSTSNANDAIVAEIEKLQANGGSAQDIQTQWNTFSTELASTYPDVADQITQLNTIASGLTTTDQWQAFFDLVSDRIIQLQQGSSSDDSNDEAASASATTDDESSTTHTDNHDDLEWLFAHRNSHDNQATW